MVTCVKFVIFICAIKLTISARILGIVPTASYSHQIVFQPLWRELSLRGHQVTTMTTDPIKDPSLTNLTEIDLHFVYGIIQSKIVDLIKANDESIFKMLDIIMPVMRKSIDQQLSHPEVQKIIKNKTEHFDLVILEQLFPTMVVFAKRFNCPLIGISSLDILNSQYSVIGNPAHPVLNPDFVLPFFGELTFAERVASVFYEIFVIFHSILYVLPYEQMLIEKHFGNNYPPFYEIMKNVSMIFVNTDPIFHRIRPLVPTVVQIGGGSHLQPSKPLPKDLQRIIDKAKNGFIYFSLGSNVKSKDLSEPIRNVFLETFAELPYLILWKFELEELPGKPDNVIISKWFPQQDILSQKSIKLFITQGGLQSIDEAIFNHVPMLGFPFYADQANNLKRMASKELGLLLDYKTVDKQTLKEAIFELVNNPKYRNRIKELADLAKDEPMTGLERAVWWTEYVIRHKGAAHLRSPAADIPFYQYYLLDVISFCLLVLAAIIILVVMLVKRIVRLLNNFKGKAKFKAQ